MTPKQLAISCARSAGQELKKLFFSRAFQTTNKSKHEIVTTADQLAEKIILSAIKKHFPTHQIISEESGATKNKSDYIWVIDPLDGTTNFFMHNPIFSISIGLLHKGEPIMGIVYAPILDEMYFAEKGKGAFVNNKRMTTSTRREIKDSYLTFCHGHEGRSIKQSIAIYQRLKMKSKDFRQLGSAAIEMAFVARGITDCILIPGVMSWDVAAGTVLVREAGGIVTDFDNNDWDLNSNNILASNKPLHKKLLAEIKHAL